MPMLNAGPVDQITWEDVLTFCTERIAEGAYLDYKEDFPSNLEKTIAALANTFGGMILIGVAEDDENRPVIPPRGIPFQRGLSEKVLNIILSNITPPVFPEIAVIREPGGERAFVLIRVSQSHQAPHAISSNTQVYLRTGNRNSPEELARFDQIEWLRDHRRKAEDLRERLYARSVDRFLTLYRQHRAANPQVPELTQGWLSVSLCPMYPRAPFLRLLR